MIALAVCEDERELARALAEAAARILREAGEACRVSCFGTAEELLGAEAGFDILLLDIGLPEMDGLALAERLRQEERACAVIFVTALAERVFEAFAVEAVDYLVKPVQEARLADALLRALARLRRAPEDALLVQRANWSRAVPLAQILYGEVIDRKVYLHTTTEVVDYYGKMEALEKQLDERFFRCHRSFVVNLDQVRAYNGGRLTLSNGEVIPVSRLRHQAFLAAMLAHLSQREGG